MDQKEKAIFCWSGGKDSALALYKVLLENKLEVVALLTTLNATYKRVSMHGVREELLEQQAASIGLPLIKMYVNEGTNSEYEKEMEALLLLYKQKGVKKVIFGDIFLDDLRQYREKNLEKVNLLAIFPLWKRDTKELIAEFLDLKFKTITCCVNDSYLDKDKVGVNVDREFISSLPDLVDPCGENGEFHTFCYAGPVFKKPIEYALGEKIYKPLEIINPEHTDKLPVTKGFWYCELLPLR
ncbi:MAG: diphthine--ammonia ligase [Bacteroidetes bacterium]|nr:diphthine--ammonia ligase [Bacteroidota bacterium]